MKKSALFIAADGSKCTGCRACELACFAAHNNKTNGVGTTVGTVTVPVTPRLYLVQGADICLPVQCKHCEDAPCLAACAKRAIRRVEGQVIIDEARCIGCKDCILACPFGAITILPVWEKGKPVLQPGSDLPRKTASKCDLCCGSEAGPACVRACPNGALRLVDPEEECLTKNLRAAESLMFTK